MNIVLIGMRGSGKTTVGRMLAARLGREFVEMDEEIVKKTGLSVVDIFAKHGPEYFRDRESEIVDELIDGRDNLVVATGGGVVMREHNVERLKKDSVCIWLQASLETLVKRTMVDPKTEHLRPRLTGKSDPYEEAAEIFAIREPLYTKAADEMIDTDACATLEDIIDKTVEILQKHNITA